ncbi:MAG: hypothetical protein AAFV29_06485 [Myxococcota bacterium]
MAATACGGQSAAPGPQQAGAAAINAATNAQLQPGGRTGATDDVRTADIDNDGRPEVFKYYQTIPDVDKPGQKKTVLVRQDLDVNWDGKIDIWRYFTAAGLPAKEEWDTDYDGNIDETRTFEDGKIVKSERDRNNDGRTDVFRYYREGKLERKESDTNGDGAVDRWEYYKGRVLDRVGVDKDHDGTVDAWAKSEKTPG